MAPEQKEKREGRILLCLTVDGVMRSTCLKIFLGFEIFKRSAYTVHIYSILYSPHGFPGIITHTCARRPTSLALARLSISAHLRRWCWPLSGIWARYLSQPIARWWLAAWQLDRAIARTCRFGGIAVAQTRFIYTQTQAHRLIANALPTANLGISVDGLG